MRVCAGIPNVCPPLCTWEQTRDGTYTLADIQRFHYTLDELSHYRIEAINER